MPTKFQLQVLGATFLLLGFGGTSVQAHHVDGSGLNLGTENPARWMGPVDVYWPVDDPVPGACSGAEAVHRAVKPLVPVDDPSVPELQGACNPDDPIFQSLARLKNGDPMLNPLVGNPQTGQVTCETDADPVFGTPSHAGVGGLCYMSSGFVDGTDFVDWTDCRAGGISNRKYDPFTSGTKPLTCSAVPTRPGVVPPTGTYPVATSSRRELVGFQMLDYGEQAVPFLSEIGGMQCDQPASHTTVVDLNWLHKTGEGHVKGYPTMAPGGPIGATGSYIAFPVAEDELPYFSPCHGAAPWFQVTLPPRPMGSARLEATPQDQQVTLTMGMEDLVNPVLAWNIYRGTGGSADTLLTTILGGTTMIHTDAPLVNGVHYWYQVMPIGLHGPGPMSNEADATPAPPPPPEDPEVEDPMNEDLPEEEMDPTNLDYLRSGHYHAEKQANETSDVVDQLISAAIAGNVSQALNVIYNVTPVPAPIRNATALVELTHEAALALVRCAPGPGPTNATTPDNLVVGQSSWLAAQMGPFQDNVTAAAANATTQVGECVTETVLPFLDSLANLTIQFVDDIQDYAFETSDDQAPFFDEALDAILPFDFEETSESLLEDPVGTIGEIALSAPEMLSNPSFAQEVVDGTQAAIDHVVATIVKPMDRHPQLVHDLSVQNGLEDVWLQIAAANRETDQHGIDIISYADSPSFNLYTQRGGAEGIHALVIGRRTCIQLDATTSTRDDNGCDVYATGTVSAGALPAPGPRTGWRATPTLVIEKATNASFGLEALAYFQVAGASYVAVAGFDATDLPGRLEVSLAGLGTAPDGREVTLSVLHDGDGLPVQAIGGGFPVDTSEPGKPAIPDNETILHAWSTAMPAQTRVNARVIQGTAAWSNETSFGFAISAPADLDVLFREQDATGLALGSLHVEDLATGESSLVAAYDSKVSLKWRGSANVIDAGFVDGTVSTRAFQLNGTDLQRAFNITSNPVLHLHSFDAACAPASLDFLVVAGADSCPNDVRQPRSFYAQSVPNGPCASGHLADMSSMSSRSTQSLAVMAGTSESDAGLTVTILDGSPVSLAMPVSPSDWQSTYLVAENATSRWSWQASGPITQLDLGTKLPKGARSEAFSVAATDLPGTVDASLELLQGRGELAGSSTIGSIAMALSNTGKAPTATSASDYARLRIAQQGNGLVGESAWKAGSVRSLSSRLLANGTIAIEGVFDEPRPLHAVYQDADHNVEAKAASLDGAFAFWILESREGGLRIQQTAEQAPGPVLLRGRLPAGSFDARLDAPARFAFAANLTDQSVSFASSALTEKIAVSYGHGGKAPAITREQSVIVLRQPSDRVGFQVVAHNLSRLAVTHLPGQIVFASNWDSSKPLEMRFQDTKETLVLLASSTPPHATLALRPGNFAWTADGSRDLDVRLNEAASRFFSLQGTLVPTLAVTWTAPYTAAFDAMVSATGPLPALALADRLGDAGWRMSALNLPETLRWSANPSQGASAIEVLPATATVGSVQAAYAVSAPLPALVQQGTLLRQAGNSHAAAIRYDAVQHAVVASAPSLSVDVQRLVPGLVAVQIARNDDAFNFQSTSAPTFIANAQADPSGTRVDWQSSTTGGVVTLRDRSNATLDQAWRISPSPLSFQAVVASNGFNISSSIPVDLQLQVAQNLTQAPWKAAGDFAIVRSTAQALRLTGVRSMGFDPILRTMSFDGNSATSPFAAELVSPTSIVLVVLSDLADGTRLAWDASAPRATYSGPDLAALRLSEDTSRQGGSRLLMRGARLAAGTTHVTAAYGRQAFEVRTPMPAEVWFTAEQSSSNPLRSLTTLGATVNTNEQGNSILVHTNGTTLVRAFLVPAGTANGPEIRIEGIGTGPARYTLANGELRVQADLSGTNAGTTTLAFPGAGGLAPQFGANNVAGQTIELAQSNGDDRIQAKVTSAPSAWSFAHSGGSQFYGATGSAAILEASGSWGGSAFQGVVLAPINQFSATADGFSSGPAPSGPATWALAAQGGSGGPTLVRPNVPGDYVFADRTGGGAYAIRLPSLGSLTWTFGAAGSPIALDLVGSPSSTVGTLQLRGPGHLTSAKFPSGLPSTLELDLTPTTTWDLAAQLNGKSMALTHQSGSDGLSLTATSAHAIGVSFHPGEATPFRMTSAADALKVETRWSGASLRITATQPPSSFVVQAGVVPAVGRVAAVGASGSIELLYLPSGGAANHFTSRSDHIAVETAGQTPYVALRATALQEATWAVPQGTGAELRGRLARASTSASALVLAGPAQSSMAFFGPGSPEVSVTASRGGALDLQIQSAGQAQSVYLIHRDSGNVTTASLGQAMGLTRLTATGDEPARIAIDSNGLSNVAIRSTHNGVALGLAATQPTSHLEAAVHRASCDVANPFKGHVSTKGTGNAGTVTAFVGDGGVVPDVGSGWAFDARCSGGKANFGMRLPHVQETSWSASQCKHDYSFDASTESTKYAVQTPQGFLELTARLESQVDGRIVFTGSESGGIQHGASDRFAALKETMTLPTCMDFQAPLQSYTLSGTSIPGDLGINLNPQTGTSGELFDTVRVASASGAGSGRLTLFGMLAKVPNLNAYRAQIEYLSPFDRIDVHLYDTQPRTAEGIHAERVVAVRNSDYFDYHTVFHDSKRVDGDVKHLSCGGDDTINMFYERIPGRAKKPITFIADLGVDCDRQRFDMDAYSENMEYKIEWDHLFRNSIHAELTQPLGSLHWWRASHRIGETQVRAPYPMAWYVAVKGAPAGELDVAVRPGVAGQIVAGSTGGEIDSINVGIAVEGSTTWYVSLHMTDVKLKVEWDLDGDTRYDGNPRYIFADTDGSSVPMNLRFRFDTVGFGLPGSVVRFNDLQVKWGFADLGVVSLPWFKRAGSVTFLPSFQIEVLLGGEWYRVPRPLFV